MDGALLAYVWQRRGEFKVGNEWERVLKTLLEDVPDADSEVGSVDPKLHNGPSSAGRTMVRRPRTGMSLGTELGS